MAFSSTPTQFEFAASKARVRLLAGPIGGGKSVACTHEIMRWAAMDQQPDPTGVRKTRFLIVRNTADQLRSTTQKTVFDWFPPGQVAEWKATEKTLYFRFKLPDGTSVYSEWMFLALDTPDDVRKALSLEATGVWGNECRELHPDVVDGLLMRVGRYPSMKDGGCTRAGAIFDTNMPEIDSYWHHQMTEPPKNWSVHIQPPAVIPLEDYLEKYREDPPEADVATSAEDVQYVTNPDAENRLNLPQDYYPSNAEAKSEDFIGVYLRCKYGRAMGGMPVYDRTFREDFHVAKHPLVPIKSAAYPIIIGLDFGRTPAAIFMQVDTRGRLLILSETVAENMGIEMFLRKNLTPHINQFYLGASFVVAPDPAGFARGQVGEQSPVMVVRDSGFRIQRPVSNSPAVRIGTVEDWLGRQIDGGPALLIDPTRAPTLLNGFRHGYRWETTKKGDMKLPGDDPAPVKNKYSHPHDACQYGAMIASAGAVGGLLQDNSITEVVPPAAAWT